MLLKHSARMAELARRSDAAKLAGTTGSVRVT